MCCVYLSSGLDKTISKSRNIPPIRTGSKPYTIQPNADGVLSPHCGLTVACLPTPGNVREIDFMTKVAKCSKFKHWWWSQFVGLARLLNDCQFLRAGVSYSKSHTDLRCIVTSFSCSLPQRLSSRPSRRVRNVCSSSILPEFGLERSAFMKPANYSRTSTLILPLAVLPRGPVWGIYLFALTNWYILCSSFTEPLLDK